MKKKELFQSKLNKFYKSGFVVLENLFNKKKLVLFKKEIDKLSNELIKNYEKPYINLTVDKKLNTAHHINKIFPNTELMKIQNNLFLKKFINKIFKKKMIMKNLEIFAKPAKTGLKAPFHQDNFYWNIKNKMALNVWLSIDKSHIFNGGLIYLDGSHKLGLLEHFSSNTPGTSKQIDPKILKNIKLKKIAPKLKPGDCLIHHCEVVHGSRANKSKFKRRGVALRFVAKHSRIDQQKMKRYLNSSKN